MAVTKVWVVYGACGHRQRESFNESFKYDFSDNCEGTRILRGYNSDRTGTNEYTIISITRDTLELCEEEFDGQLTDGIFENSVVGEVFELNNDYHDDYWFETFPVDDKFYDREFCVPFDWFMDWLQHEGELFEEFMRKYTWEDTFPMYCKAKEDGIVYKEIDID